MDYLYSPADHDLPEGMSAADLRRYPATHYQMEVTEHVHTPPGELKPNPGVLLDILRQVGASPEDAIYVGDSPMKDIAMAQAAGVLDAHAAYGVAQHTAAYELLRAVTHWPDSAVTDENAALTSEGFRPTIILSERLDELRKHVRFSRFQRIAA
ncbi:MAG: HAD family hydrolase [Pseudomonadota bacterium]|nr:HAD family hydrolase [Pseudomonadota bacterium]